MRNLANDTVSFSLPLAQLVKIPDLSYDVTGIISCFLHNDFSIFLSSLQFSSSVFLLFFC